ncbi:arylsulfatase [Halosquirtibacter xylanolyticus]|uniref:sulfatase family protein n=1 Tax=Halosquirtibacter xylanolyticus TaxID=3374599 RepID=UPI003748EB4C|nr:arylsulfatase [Prolixibacteraceae bacterium]
MKPLKHGWLVLSAFLASCGTKEAPQPTQPNVIYILADDLGYGDIEAFNSSCKIKTPHLNQLAKEGAMFTDMHTSSAVCTPTRYGILTGRYNWRSSLKNGVTWGDSKALIDSSRNTVADLFHKKGYQTAFIGKWHLGWDWTMKEDKSIDFSKPVTNNPNDVGFDYAYGHAASLDIPPYVYVENGKATAIPTRKIDKVTGYGFYRKGWIAPDFTIEDATPNFFRRAKKYVAEQVTNKKPFFLYLPIPSPHTPIVPTKEWQGKSGLNPYGDFVMMIDHYVGDLMAELKKQGIDKNTIVVFTSDNGCSPMARFDVLKEKGHDPSANYRGHKADIFEGGHHVPFIVHWPKGIKAGTKIDKTSCTTDFMATAAEIIEQPLEDRDAVDSYSMLSMLQKGNTGEYTRDYTIHHSINGSFAIRQGDWKLELCAGSGGWSAPKPKKAKELNLPNIQLYNIAKDPQETNNVFQDNPEVVKTMYTTLMKCINDGRSTVGTKQQNSEGSKGWPQLKKLNNLSQEITAL